MRMAPNPPKSNSPIPAAVVAFIRDTDRGLQVYLSRRPDHFRYYPGAFVFPGGRADAEDSDLKSTACREVKEEIGVTIHPDRLRLLRQTHTSPHAGPVYHMFTFVYPVTGDFQTRLNPGEVEEELWITLAEALARLELPYQIMAALWTIAQFTNVESLMDSLR